MPAVPARAPARTRGSPPIRDAPSTTPRWRLDRPSAIPQSGAPAAVPSVPERACTSHVDPDRRDPTRTCWTPAAPAPRRIAIRTPPSEASTPRLSRRLRASELSRARPPRHGRVDVGAAASSSGSRPRSRTPPTRRRVPRKLATRVPSGARPGSTATQPVIGPRTSAAVRPGRSRCHTEASLTSAPAPAAATSAARQAAAGLAARTILARPPPWPRRPDAHRARGSARSPAITVRPRSPGAPTSRRARDVPPNRRSRRPARPGRPGA